MVAVRGAAQRRGPTTISHAPCVHAIDAADPSALVHHFIVVRWTVAIWPADTSQQEAHGITGSKRTDDSNPRVGSIVSNLSDMLHGLAAVAVY